MNNKLVANLRVTDRMVPVILLAAVFAAFGLLIPWLGLYWDDWPVIYMYKTLGISGFWDFYQYDRPLSAWTYIVFSPILGARPWMWHVFTLLLRWLTAVFIWLSLRAVWPRKSHQTFWISLLFAVTPIFVLQYVSVAYSQHWICYLFYFASIYSMLKFLDGNKHAIWLLGLSVLLGVAQMLTMEYFLGLELLRPAFLWFYFREHHPDIKTANILKQIFKTVWVYLVLLFGYVIWRVFFLEIEGGDPNALVFPAQFLESPFQALIDLVQMAFQDLAFLLTSWISTFTPSNLNLHRPFSLAVLGVVATIGFAAWLSLDRYNAFVEPQQGDDRWHLSALSLGLIATLLGMLPVWMVGRQASVGPIGNRFSLAALFGVCVALVSLLEWITPRMKVKTVVISMMLMFALHTNLFHAKEFQLSWEKQRTFYWQLYWRAPHIQPGTAFISDSEIFPFVGVYSTSMGISSLYPPVEIPQDMPYWFFPYWRDLYQYPDEILQGKILEYGLRNYLFQGNSRDSLVIFFEPVNNACLRVLSNRDVDDRFIPDSVRGLLDVSDLTRIGRTPLAGHTPPEDIFGSEPEHDWCYFFEKAELAYQHKDWMEVIRLMDDAKANELSPSGAQEYLPLLDAYLFTGDIEGALALSLHINRISNQIDDRICTAWLDDRVQKSNADYANALDAIWVKFNCFD